MIREDSIENSSDIAIIGYAARFPGAENAAQFWDNLSRGVESIRSFSALELESVGVAKSVIHHPDYVRAGAPLFHLDAFDHGFFGISPREAAIMDPQQRFFLESAWEALEHAGYAPGTFAGSTGVFAGSGPNSYLYYNLLSDPELAGKEGLFLLRHTGNDKDVLATRVSYQMNLRGPSINVQTACSTSLVAVHLACQSLLQLGCDMALAGAVSIEIPHAIGYRYRPNEIQSRDGHCRAFDAAATGTVFGSGIGIVVLRRLSDAIAAGDTIHAVIKGSAVNNDGGRKVGFFAPSAEGQVEVIREALGAAGVDPASIDYVETHGTGTPIGDPIELSALDQVFSDRKTPLKIGSVKTNIGHLDTAAGMAGLLKTILALGHREIPPTLHFRNLNPLVDATQTKLHVVDRRTEWNPSSDTQARRRAGVTALGIGGTNAHIILEEPPAPTSSHALRPVRLLTLSAKSAQALDDVTRALADHLRRFPDENLDDVAYTLHCGRSEFVHRRTFVARDHQQAMQHAESPNSSGVVTAQNSEPRPVAFLFSGQGSQAVNMGRELYQTEPLFRQWIDTCATLALPHLGYDFRQILYPAPETAAHAAEQIKLTWNAQPILFAVEYALAQLWISWGIRPAKLIGHSLGEYPAACLSGIFNLEDAVSLVCARGNLVKKISPGAMLAVPLSEAEITPWIHDGLALAAVNSARQCVVSGSHTAISALQEELAQKGTATHRLETSHAFHSSAIDPILDLFTELVAQKQLRAPQIPMVSNVTGTWLTEEEARSPEYWARHLRQTVRFQDGLATLQATGTNYLLEVGPGETLTTLSRQSGGREARQTILPSLPRPTEKAGDLTHLLFALGHLWAQGISVDWTAFHANDRLRRIPLPTYSFQRKRHWLGPKIGTNWLGDSLGKVEDWFYRTTWKPAPLALAKATVSTEPLLVLCDHSSEQLKIVEKLRQQGAEVITVTPGPGFRATGGESYEINLSSPDDFKALIDHLVLKRQAPRHVVHLWGLKPLAPPASAEEFCFHSLLFFIQSLGTRMTDRPVALTAISQRSVSIHHEPVLHPFGSLLSGPCRVAPLEYPNLRCRQIDIDSTDPAALATLILREGQSDTAASLAVYRDGERWTQDIERFRLEPSMDRVRDRGTYLITGGLGGLGLAVADWLARHHHARLILLSRHATEQAAAHQSQFEEWRKLGADVMVLSADVTNLESLRPALAAAREKFGPLHGIIHAAGILHDGIIQLKTESIAREVLAPKIEGVQNLDELTRDQPLDFFALFSSVSALTPPGGQVDYCSANAFLNAFARSRPADRNFFVIGWGAWAQTGMGAPKSDAIHHPLLDRVELETAARAIYSGTLSVEQNWILGEHRFKGGDSLLPGTAYLDMALTALWKKIGRQPVTLEDIVFQAPLRVAQQSSCLVHAELRKAETDYHFTVSSDDVVYASGLCRPAGGRPARINLEEIEARCHFEKKDEPTNIRQRGHFDFGPHWDSVRRIAFGQDECLALVELPAEFQAETRDFFLHPALMDAATGVALYLIPGYDQEGDMHLPFAYQRLTVYQSLPARIYSHARMHPGGSDLLIFDVTLAAESGEILAEIEGFTVKRLRSLAELPRLEPEAVSRTAPRDSHDEILPGIPTKEGIAALQHILKSRLADIVYVSPSPLIPAAPMKETVARGEPATASSDDIELVLKQLWQRLLGLDEINAQTDFFDSGGHSLLAVRLFAEIRQRFNIDFGLSTLFEARTISALSGLIRQSRDADRSQKSPASGSALVPIRSSGGANFPLFLIHDVGGSVLRYEHLARHFPADQSIFAIESRGLNGLRTDYTVEEMARHYLVQIRERQPHGPYYVAGHSFGGLVAYEIARQLTAQGETMGLVGLLDTFQRSLNEDDAATQATPRVGKLPIHRRLLADLRAIILGQDRIGYLQERRTFIRAWAVKTIYRTAFRLSNRLGRRMPSFLNDVKEANWIASDYFTAGTYDGEVVLFRCQHRLDTDPPDSSRIWQRTARDGVVIVDVPGDHNSMLREPNVQILAGQILARLQPKTATP